MELTGPAEVAGEMFGWFEDVPEIVPLHWPPALAARESAADGFAAAGLPGESAVERLAVAAHLRSAASFRAALRKLGCRTRAEAVRRLAATHTGGA